MSSDQAIFAMAFTDHSGKPLSGTKNYTLHIMAMPPAREGWSLTAYTLKGALILNALNRYQFNNKSEFTKNTDGSVDILVQADQPIDASQAKNWLPVPNGEGFELIWRLLGPEPKAIDGILDGSGWQPPAIMVAP
jgi:hypothetical protein